MKSDTLAGTRTPNVEPPRSTAYYYADLERFRKSKPTAQVNEVKDNQNELSEYVEANEVVNDGAIREVPPLRDRQWSLPEYSIPECRKVETYSTAGTFPMPETKILKEKEPLLAELEVVGRLPLTQLDSSSGVRRSRSWYLCCPNVGDEEISRESSWRYSSLRTVTAPPVPGQNGLSHLVAFQSSGQDDIATLRSERDSLARALAAERHRAATTARAHDARLAELHGVIAELVRRRAADKQSRAIPEEEVSDECDSTTQPAGELDDDADRSRTELNDTSSAVSPEELPSPQVPKVDHEQPEDSTDTSTHEVDDRTPEPRVDVSPSRDCDTSLDLSERDSELCDSSTRCWQESREDSGGSCDRERGSPTAVYPIPSGYERRQAKMASRVRLRRTDETDPNNVSEYARFVEAAEKLALDVCAQADIRETLATADAVGCAEVCACRAALRAADRALETYDVLLALAETQTQTAAATTDHRLSAEAVAWQLLQQLDDDQDDGPALSPGPWMTMRAGAAPEVVLVSRRAGAGAAWGAREEGRLRAHAARLKADTVRLRPRAGPPAYHRRHDENGDEIPKTTGVFNLADMEAAVLTEGMLSARATLSARSSSRHTYEHCHKSESNRTRRRRERRWREAHASETDL